MTIRRSHRKARWPVRTAVVRVACLPTVSAAAKARANELLAAVLALPVALSLVSVAAVAQVGVDPAILRSHAGVYSPECGNPKALRLRVTGDTLVAERAGKSVTGTGVRAAHAYFGNSPPAGFRLALLGDVAGGDELVFQIYEDASGKYALADGGPRVRAAIGREALGRRVRHCDANRSAQVAAPAEAPTASPAQLLRDPGFRSAYLRALGPLTKEAWLTRLDGPAPPLRQVRVAGAEYTLVASCQPHDCGANNLVLLYAAGRQQVYGRLQQGGKAYRLGGPPPAVARELERLWRAEWRRH